MPGESKQEDFENILFPSSDRDNSGKIEKRPTEQGGDKEEDGGEKKFELMRCQYCEDVGACSFCERGRKYALEHPLKPEKRREGRRKK